MTTTTAGTAPTASTTLSPVVGTHAGLQMIAAGLDLIDSAEWEVLSASVVVELMMTARRLRDRVAALSSALTGHCEARQASMVVSGTPLGSLVAVSDGLGLGQASREVLTASAVREVPRVERASLAGEVSVRHAAAIASAMRELPSGLTAAQQDEAQDVFVRRAQGRTPGQISGLVGAVVAEVAPELVPTPEQKLAGVEAQQRRAAQRRFFRWGAADGSVWFKGELPEVAAAPFIGSIQALIESERRRSRDRFRAMRAAGADTATLVAARKAETAPTPAQRAADALIAYIGDHRDAPSVAGDRPRVVVTMREADLRQRAEQAGLLASGTRIGAGELRRLCCDADLTPAVLGGASEVLDMGRTHRLVTPPIRRALSLRDSGCVFPGCDMPDARCEAHHIVPWWAGGDTAIHNLVLLCAHHHALIEPHRFGPDADQWRIRLDDRGRPVITPPRRYQTRASRTDDPAEHGWRPTPQVGTDRGETGAPAGPAGLGPECPGRREGGAGPEDPGDPACPGGRGGPAGPGGPGGPGTPPDSGSPEGGAAGWFVESNTEHPATCRERTDPDQPELVQLE